LAGRLFECPFHEARGYPDSILIARGSPCMLHQLHYVGVVHTNAHIAQDIQRGLVDFLAVAALE
jgi:hypothetical protein